MKNTILLIFISTFFFFSFFSTTLASGTCSSNGYTILTINGIFTNRIEAKKNKDNLKKFFLSTFHNQPLTVDFLYNPTHLAGAGDLIDSVAQGLFNEKSDYDLTEMLNAASKKVKTEKLLLVAHSQGNFYANNFYNKVIDREGGIPRKSIAVYSVASPAKYVAGGGKYLTSSTDSVINEVRYFIKDTLKSNVDIKLNKTDDKFGHSFSNVYLKYQGPRIISDIHSELSDLKNNNIQNLNAPCLAPPKLTFIHKVKGIAYEVADPTANLVKYGVSGAYKVNTYLVRRVADVGVKVKNTFKKLLASAVGSETNSVNTIQVAKTTVGTTSSTPNLLVKGSTKIISTTKKIKKTPVIKLLTKVNQNKNNEKKVNKTKTTVSDKIISQIKKPTKENTIVKLVNKNRIQNPEIKTNTITDQNMPVNNTVYYYGGGGGASSLPPPDKPIILDTIAPVISMIGDNSVIVNQGDNYKDDGATAFDETDGVVKVVVTGKVNTATLGTYVITYTASDLSKNTSTLTRTVKVESPFPNLIINSDTTLSAGEYSYNNLIITNNATLTLEGDSSSSNLFKGVKINANNLTLDSGSTITASSQGPTKGPGTSTEDYSGGSYGGQGEGNTLATTYGSATKPIDLGSGGTAGQPSGGAIRLVINDTLQNDGIISTNGRSNSSGGSIYVTTKNLTGTGSFQADGGGYYTSSVYYGTGSGGRIALYYETSTFTGTALAQGGCGSPSGTLYCASDGSVGFFDTLNNNLLINSSWQFRASDSPFNFNDIDISNKAKVTTEKDAKITAHKINIDGGSTLTLGGDESIVVNNINLLGDSMFTVIPEKILFLDVHNIYVEKGSIISANGKGYLKGPGSPDVFTDGGSSYGGLGGGSKVKPVYGSAIKPIDFGSGNGSRRGGGAIRLIVSNVLKNNGTISSNAGFDYVSGGSIYITADKIVGSGVFSTRGGSSYFPYKTLGGGGGRIALHYKKDFSFTGISVVSGGIYCSSNCNSVDGYGTVEKIDDSIIIPLSSKKQIASFSFLGLSPKIEGAIDKTKHKILITVPSDTDVTTLTPTVVYTGTSVSPLSGVVNDFTSPVTYTTTAEDGTTQSYIVTVIVSTPTIDTTPPSIINYTLNGATSDITINPLKTPLKLSFTSSGNVNWMSIKIESQTDSSFYKMFHSDTKKCIDGTDTCVKTWDGILSKGGLLKNDTFLIKVHIKDKAGEYYDYLPSIITVDTSLKS